jgi:hypothetical protein
MRELVRRLDIRRRGSSNTAADHGAPRGAGRLVLAGDDADVRDAARRLRPEAGTLDVVVHGSVDDVIVKVGGQELHLDQRHLARFIKGQAGAAEYERIRLVSCRTGAHPKAVAQHLANQLGVEVIAPSDKLFVNPDGSIVIGPSKDRNTGRWVSFAPTKSGPRYKRAAEARRDGGGRSTPAQEPEVPDVAHGTEMTEGGPPKRPATDAEPAADAEGGPAKWIDEKAHMSKDAREYQDGAHGARSNRVTRAPQAPELDYSAADGSTQTVRFDGVQGRMMIDRKKAMTTFPKSEKQALRQSEALRQNGLTALAAH